MNIRKEKLMKTMKKGGKRMDLILKEILNQFNIEDEGKILKPEDADALSLKKKTELMEAYLKEMRKRVR